jgi:mannose-6-phosphate isomerase-like protein (cupin superfamily)
MDKVNLAEKLAAFSEPWSPRILGELNGELNGQQVKVAKFKGEFIWHLHQAEDELFLVLKGQIRIYLRDRVVDLHEGEFFIVPRGVGHKPVSDAEAHVLLVEPISTVNTGSLLNELTVDRPERI